MAGVRWIRMGLMLVAALAILSGIALAEWGQGPETALGWVMLPLGGVTLLLLEFFGEEALLRANRVLTLRGLLLWTAVVVLFAIAIAVGWTLFA
jgi:hypothetical protein